MYSYIIKVFMLLHNKINVIIQFNFTKRPYLKDHLKITKRNSSQKLLGM